jgi:hypothetical protein
MDYYLQPAFLSAPPPLEISRDEYHALINSRLVLNAVFSFEENYDLLIGNYLELENSVLSLSTSTMLRQTREYGDMFEINAEMNRRAVNFLSSAKLFADQILQRVRVCGGDREKVKAQMSKQYDGSFEYRFMEALRNHVQHSGSAVHSLSIGGEWWPKNKRIKQIYALKVFTQKRFLSLDPKFKDATLKECPEQVDFMSAARMYLQSLSLVHDFARSEIRESVNTARSSFESAIQQYKNFSKESSIGLTAYSSLENEKTKSVSILIDWDDVRMKLEKRNGSLQNLSSRIISSEMIPNFDIKND